MTIYLLVLPHASSNVVTVAELISETLALIIKEKTTDTTERLSSQELDLGLGILGVYETGRVNLNLLEVNSLRSDGHREFLSITSAVIAVGGGEFPELRAMLLEKSKEDDK